MTAHNRLFVRTYFISLRFTANWISFENTVKSSTKICQLPERRRSKMKENELQLFLAIIVIRHFRRLSKTFTNKHFSLALSLSPSFSSFNFLRKRFFYTLSLNNKYRDYWSAQEKLVIWTKKFRMLSSKIEIKMYFDKALS